MNERTARRVTDYIAFGAVLVGGAWVLCVATARGGVCVLPAPGSSASFIEEANRAAAILTLKVKLAFATPGLLMLAGGFALFTARAWARMMWISMMGVSALFTFVIVACSGWYLVMHESRP